MTLLLGSYRGDVCAAWDSVSSLASKTNVLLLCFVRQSGVSSVVMVCVENIDAFLHHLEVGEEDHVHNA